MLCVSFLCRLTGRGASPRRSHAEHGNDMNDMKVVDIDGGNRDVGAVGWGDRGGVAAQSPTPALFCSAAVIAFVLGLGWAG
jgi:hypothetical protein